jgi:hypothetical protein
MTLKKKERHGAGPAGYVSHFGSDKYVHGGISPLSLLSAWIISGRFSDITWKEPW